MNNIISEIMYLYENGDSSLEKVLYSVLSKYNFELKKNELCRVDDSWNEILVSFFQMMFIKGCAETTLDNYKTILINAFSVINKQITEITPNDIELYFIYKRNKCNCCNSYIHNIRTVLNVFFTWCESNRYVLYNPIKAVAEVKFIPTKVYGFTEEEVERMRNACDNTRFPLRNRCIVELLYSSGLRASELIALNIEDINLYNCNGIVRHGKGGEEGIFYFSTITAYYLKKYLKTRGDVLNKDPLFVSRSKNRFARVDTLENIITTLGNIGNVEGARPHRFRHTFITRCINRGMPVNDTKTLARHKNVDTTMIYYDGNQSKVEEAYRQYCG